MLFFASGFPRCDAFQFLENRLSEGRLLTVHGSYLTAAKKYFEYVNRGIVDLTSWKDNVADWRAWLDKRDERFTKKYTGREFDCHDILLRLELATQSCAPLPREVMLDSGAFTAWTKGEQITVDEVSKSYEECLKYAHFFDKVWLVNLDVIPGAPRKQVDCAELDRAIEQSILNLEVLTTRFGNRVLGVFHQDEPLKYLDKLISLSSSSSCYLALSPRNDLPESVRVEWAKSITRRVPSNIKTHGLATMGVSMSRDVKWSSGDSAAWIQNSGFGMVDLFFTARETTLCKDRFISYRIGDKAMTLSSVEKETIATKVSELGVTFEEVALDYRVRDMVNLANRAKFMDESAGSLVINQQELF
jgi:hypothetical protein